LSLVYSLYSIYYSATYLIDYSAANGAQYCACALKIGYARSSTRDGFLCLELDRR
jgi:hypothetical protein